VTADVLVMARGQRPAIASGLCAQACGVVASRRRPHSPWGNTAYRVLGTFKENSSPKGSAHLPGAPAGRNCSQLFRIGLR